jgi:hypothetical protein
LLEIGTFSALGLDSFMAVGCRAPSLPGGVAAAAGLDSRLFWG